MTKTKNVKTIKKKQFIILKYMYPICKIQVKNSDKKLFWVRYIKKFNYLSKNWYYKNYSTYNITYLLIHNFKIYHLLKNTRISDV